MISQKQPRPVKESKLCYEDQQAVAYALYRAGFAPEWSSNMADMLTAGYTCNDYGSFVYPLSLYEDGTVVPWEKVKAANDQIQRENEAKDFYTADLETMMFGDYVRFNGTIFEAVAVPRNHRENNIGFVSLDQDFCIATPTYSSCSLEMWQTVQEFKNAIVKELRGK